VRSFEDVLNHLTGVYMPRGANVQSRTFNYTTGTTVGAFLLSATNPENGTVNYTYDGSNRLASKTDAKGQQLTYQYDTYNRMTSVTWANKTGGAQVLRTYYYDTNPLDSTGTFSQYAAGRLTAVQYANIRQNPDVSSNPLPIQLNDMYSYTQAGLPAAKRLQVNEVVYHGAPHYTQTANLDSTYTYNNEGKITAMTYPSTVNGAGTSIAGAGYNYSYDGMYRLSGMTDSSSNTIVNGVSYNAANQLLGMTFSGVAETRGYNVLGQLTSLNAGSENLTYNYPTGANNGKISSYTPVSGETVTYTYDTLNRLWTVSDKIGLTVQSAETYGYDAFGNLLSKMLTGGTGPTLSQAVNPGNNQIVGQTYDANGNSLASYSGYDVENRLYTIYNGPPYTIYSYDAQGKRVFLWAGTLDSNNNPTGYSLVAYSPSGQKLGTYLIYPDQTYQGHGPFTTVTLTSSDKYFGGRRLAVLDQLGSAGTYYPWGEAKGTTNPQDTWSYATYWRDSATGLDYANQRYYANAYGRFMTPDPYRANSAGPGDPGNPQNWNRYAYTAGDPVNAIDPEGTTFCFVNPSTGLIEECYDSVDVNGSTGQAGAPGPASGGDGFAGKVMPWDPIGKMAYLLQVSCTQPTHPGVGDDQIQKMIDEAESISLNAAQAGGDPVAALAGFLTAEFGPGGNWDYKKNFQTGTVAHDQARVFGNFAFGAVMEALGLTYNEAQNAAGIAQVSIELRGGAGGQGMPILQYPFGDSSSDAIEIQRGYTYEQLNAGGSCPP
jgi:RHS repeat-associated protein